MARRVPTPCTQFLEQVRVSFQYAVSNRPELSKEIKAVRPVGGRALAIQHRLAKHLRWTFSSVEGEPEQMEFNVECIPSRAIGVDGSVLAKAKDDVGLRGTARIEDGKLIFSLAWGHESQAHELIEGGLLSNNLKEFAIDGMLAMIRLLHKYGERPVVRPMEALVRSSADRRVAFCGEIGPAGTERGVFALVARSKV